MQLLAPRHWIDYELIDTGHHEKLERFGQYILIRPEPQAVWQKSLPETEWQRRSHARYIRAKGMQPSDEAMRGSWTRKPGMPDQWNIEYHHGGLKIKFRLGLTAFGHIGVFPEQAENWDYLYEQVVEGLRFKAEGLRFKVLNLFAYTGGASMAARAAGAEVVHVDSVKPVITWSREIMEASGLDHIRWVVEDAMTFVKREVRRGNLYQGIILDPPAYGRGPDGEKWVLSESVNELIALCQKLLDPKNNFFILSLYSMGFSSLIAENLVRNQFGEISDLESGELFIPDQAGRRLPLGTFLRFRNQPK
jgi:23S rRNA (cytosine1962-C5)-methyltransferase